jgi:hypothetical protein
MTLFRKVFQNQSRVASEDEALDSESLRKALSEAGDASGPLPLDPFAQMMKKESAEAWPEDRDVYEDYEDYEAEASSADNLRSPEERDEPGQKLTQEDAAEQVEEDDAETTWDNMSVPEQSHEDEEDEEEIHGAALNDAALAADGAVQSDEEIAACLGRALAKDAPVAPVVDEPANDETAEHCIAEAARHEPSGTSEDELVAPAEMRSADIADKDPMDVASFAQQQMAALKHADPAEEAGNAPLDLSGETGLEAVPAPAPGRAGRRAGRVKTRLLGFNRGGDAEHDPFGQAPEATATAQSQKFPVGWLVIVEGPGVGHAFSIFTGASMIGRGEDQVIRLDFGDNSISRHNHAAIAYDEEQNKFYIGHGGKSNIIRHNARPVLSTEELHHADLIRIGETTLRFVALCGSDFQWNTAGGAHAPGI